MPRAALVPGFPHLRAGNAAPSWKELAAATRALGNEIRAERPDALLWMSTQWFTVLGHQFQCDPNPRGEYVDENWYDFDFGQFTFDLRTDVELAESWAVEAERRGHQARRTRYPGFPIDSGTLTARELLDPDGELPLAMVSCNIYAAPDALRELGAAGAEAARRLGRRVVVVGVSALSSGYVNRWITPDEDRFERPDHDTWNRRVLDLLARGDLAEVERLRDEYAAAAEVDSQFRILAFLAGAAGLTTTATVHAYGPVWGAGAAVLSWR